MDVAECMMLLDVRVKEYEELASDRGTVLKKIGLDERCQT